MWAAYECSPPTRMILSAAELTASGWNRDFQLPDGTFAAVAGRTYQLAKERGIGQNMPTDWFLQDIRD